jgi:hypothetical protein
MHSPKDFKVFCVGCSLSGDFSISGGDVDHDPSANFSGPVAASGLSTILPWAGIVFESLRLHVELSFDLTPSNSSNELMVPLVPMEDPTRVSGSVGSFNVDVGFVPEIHGWLNTTKPVNFTWGFDITVPSGAGIFFSSENLNNPVATGFGNTTLTTTPFQASTGDLNMAFEASFRPTFGFTVSFPGGDATLQAVADLPKLDALISQVTNADSACNPVASGNSSAKVFQTLTHIVPSFGTDAGIVENNNFIEPFNPTPEPLPTACFQYDSKKKELVAPGTASGAGKLMAPTLGLLLSIFVSVMLLG